MKSFGNHIAIFCLSLFTFHFSLKSRAQEVVITGIFSGEKNATVSLWTYEDFISFAEREIETTSTDSTGNFSLRFSIPAPVEGTLKISQQAFHIYLEPDAFYQLTFTPTLSFSDTSFNNINALIGDFNRKYNDFISSNYSSLLRGKGREQVRTFIDEMNRNYEGHGADYFHVHLFYKFALIEQLTHQNDRRTLEDRYLNGKPVRFGNRAYMEFALQYFPQHLLLVSLSPAGKEIMESMKNRNIYDAWFNAIAGDSVLARNDTLAELLLLKGLYEVYFHPDFDKGDVLAALDTAALRSPVPENRKIARNIRQALLKLAQGTPAPEFELTDAAGKRVTLRDFRGRYVYLDFWATWCAPCLREMKVMERLFRKYGRQIAFVSISIDKERSAMRAFLEKNPYPWIFLHYGGDEKLKQAYNVLTIPSYFLIDPEGLLLRSPAEWPSGSIEELFFKITAPAEEKGKILPGSKE